MKIVALHTDVGELEVRSESELLKVHHVMVYGDYREQLRKLNEMLGITTIEV